MSFELLYWILMLIWLVFGIWRDRADTFRLGGHFLQFILFVLIGWRVFGPPIRP